MDQLVTVYIEIEQNSDKKYELNKETNQLEIDRILADPYVYPYSYGFITNTIAMDGKALDAIIITDKPIKNNAFYEVCIIGVLIMSDEKGKDEKVLCVLEEDYKKIYSLETLSKNIKDKIFLFFANYKNDTPGKWSKVDGFESKETAIAVYKAYKIPQ
jgi:inorganic pyrophosphatase